MQKSPLRDQMTIVAKKRGFVRKVLGRTTAATKQLIGAHSLHETDAHEEQHAQEQMQNS